MKTIRKKVFLILSAKAIMLFYSFQKRKSFHSLHLQIEKQEYWDKLPVFSEASLGETVKAFKKHKPDGKKNNIF